MRPQDYQPPITWWGHTYRLVLMLALSAIAWAPRLPYQFEHVRWWFFTDLTVGLACYVLVHWRRRYPLAVTTVTNLAGLISFSASGAGALALVSLATRRRWREIVPMVVLSSAVAVYVEWKVRIPGVAPVSTAELFLFPLFTLLVVAIGMYIGSRRELLASWQSRARLAEAEQSAKVQQARAAERARIAREMHDVLAHRISTVNVHAGVLNYRRDLTDREVQETAGIIAETSRQALTDLREVLGVLREGPGDAEPEPPQATLDIDDLIAENRLAGLRVDYRNELLGAPPPGLSRTLYRCLQEGLTNARKHAPSSLVRVQVDGSPVDGVNLVVSNGLPSHPARAALPSSGFGLVGLAERVALAGGRQRSGPTRAGGFELAVWLPWQT